MKRNQSAGWAIFALLLILSIISKIFQFLEQNPILFMLVIIVIILYIVFKVAGTPTNPIDENFKRWFKKNNETIKSNIKKNYYENGVLSSEIKTYRKDGNITRLYKYYNKEGKLENRFFYENKKKMGCQNNPLEPSQKNILTSKTKAFKNINSNVESKQAFLNHIVNNNNELDLQNINSSKNTPKNLDEDSPKNNIKKNYYENGVLSSEIKTYRKDGNITQLYKYYNKDGTQSNSLLNNIQQAEITYSKQNPAHPIKITEINNSIPSVLLDKSLENTRIGAQFNETIVKKKEASPSKIKIERLQEAKDKELRLRNELKSKESELEKTKKELEYLKLTIASTQSPPKPQIQNSTKVDDGKIVSRESLDDF